MMNWNDPKNVPDEDLEDIICRFLINLPEEELNPPRIFFHIKEASWFYADNYLPEKTILSPKADTRWEKDFARRFFFYWDYFKPQQN